MTSERSRRRSLGVSPAAFAALLPIVCLSAAQGGFFPTSWGWASVGLGVTAAIALVARSEIRLSSLERAFCATAAAFTCWVAVSAAWSVAPSASLVEFERMLLYALGVTALLVTARTRNVRQILGATTIGICAIAGFSLSTRLFPDRIGVYDGWSVYRLAQPIGYWNGLALLVVLGFLLAAGFAARGRRVGTRVAASSALVFLLPTFYFTFGRGAWVALAAGIVAALAVDPRRLQLLASMLVLGIVPAIAVVIVARQPALTHAGTDVSRAADVGHRVAAWLLLLMITNAGLGLAFAWLEARVDPGTRWRRGFGAIVIALAIAGVATTFGLYGGPVTLSQKAYRAFNAAPPHIDRNLNRRLLSFSGNGRAVFWRLAWDDASNHLVAGAGAGTYERYFLQHQPKTVGPVRDAHGLYVETLAELGVIGLALLVAFLAVPLVAVASARRHPLVPAAFGAYVAYLTHAAVDWDWELAAVTLAALVSGVAILVAQRRLRAPAPASSYLRWAAAAAVVVSSIYAAIAVLGHTALSRSHTALRQGSLVTAATEARRARRWLPWSPEPWVALARAQAAAGERSAARHSYEKALAIDDANWQTWAESAQVRTGRAEADAVKRALTLYPRAEIKPTASASDG